MALLVGNVPWADDAEPRSAVAGHLGVGVERIRDVALLKKSLDARQKHATWRAVYRVDAVGEAEILARGLHDVRAWTDRDEARYTSEWTPTRAKWTSPHPALVVGAGPAGLFAALWLAESGVPVVLFERGEPVEDRVKTVNANWRGKAPLDPESNVVIGEGGAGTFSDGKIYTRRRDGELGYIFQRLVACGADPAVLQDAYAHLGDGPWPEALQALTGKPEMDATAILDYFAPLKKWLDEQNQGKPQGW